MLSASIFFTFISLASNTFSQQKLSPNPGGYWLMYVGDNKLNKHVGLHSELQLRNLFMDRTNHSILVRVGLNVYIKPTVMATAGYGFIYGKPSSDDVSGSETLEHRVWQQLVMRQKYHNIFMEHRYRLEQRFIENLSNNTQRDDYRIRYRFQTLLPLYTLSPRLRHFFVNFNNEIMINFRSNPAKLFDRNRFFAGMGYQVSPKMNFQLGYVNQYIHVINQPKAQVDHLLQFSVTYNMDDLMQTFFRKKQDTP